MDALTTSVYVPFIEGTKSYVPAMVKELGNNEFLIISCSYFDPEDLTSLFQFIPGDKVSSGFESRTDFQGKEEVILVANNLIDSSVPDRINYMLKYIIADQNGVLTDIQQSTYKSQLDQLATELRENMAGSYHPSLLRWHKQFK
ncbi:MAG TPA: hypothetical protein VK517_18775 [Cyclobacteriaceae bacterium]|nr:hypothetical protein [Cyclobacteriaceae bacterium]